MSILRANKSCSQHTNKRNFPDQYVLFLFLIISIAQFSASRPCEINKVQRKLQQPNCNQRLQASFDDLLSFVHMLTLWFVIITQSSFILRHHLPITVQANLSHLPIPTCGHSAQFPILFARPLWSNRDFAWYIIYIYCIYVRTTMMPPRVLVSGPKPCGGNKASLHVCA